MEFIIRAALQVICWPEGRVLFFSPTVCVCVRERERETERQRQRQRE